MSMQCITGIGWASALLRGSWVSVLPVEGGADRVKYRACVPARYEPRGRGLAPLLEVYPVNLTETLAAEI